MRDDNDARTESRRTWMVVGGIIAALVVVGIAVKLFTAAPVWIHYDENYYLDISMHSIARRDLTPHMGRVTEGTHIIAVLLVVYFGSKLAFLHEIEPWWSSVTIGRTTRNWAVASPS